MMSRLIEIDEALYQLILRNTETIGEDASSILRRMLSMPAQGAKECPSAIPNGKVTDRPSSDSQRALDEAFILGANFATLYNKTKTKVYLELLSLLCKQRPESFSKVLDLKFGRDRVYFSKNRQEIEISGNSTHPRKIPGTSYWALTNTDSAQKRDILIAIMRALEYGDDAIRAAAECIP